MFQMGEMGEAALENGGSFLHHKGAMSWQKKMCEKREKWAKRCGKRQPTFKKG
jgi:hypothetical protein